VEQCLITKLEIENFKAYGERVSFKLRPLTVLIGANGSGKSSALESIGLLSQSVPTAEQAPQFKWKDRMVDFGTSGASAFHKPDHDLHLSLAFEIEAGEYFRNWLRKQNYDADINPQSLGYAVGHGRGTAEWKHELTVDGELTLTNATMALSRGVVKKGHGSLLEWHSRRSLERVFTPAASGSAVLDPKLFMAIKALGGNEVDAAAQESFATFGLFMSYMGAYLKHRVFILGPGRIPSREVPQPDAGPLSVGRRGERTITVLSVMFANPRHLAQARKIQEWAEVFGLGSLTSGWVREELLHAGYLDSTFDTPLGFESAGCGAQQILPVITQIFSAPRNSVILIEEPEASLHPDAQTDLANMLAEAVNNGHRLVITTHSQALIAALCKAGEANLIRREDLAIYRLSKSVSGARPEAVPVEHDWSIANAPARVTQIDSADSKNRVRRVHA
jgi:energy-coupling factor transporter ATP-binding protein EcfA2